MQDLLVRDFEHTETRIGDIAWRARTRGHYERTFEITLWFSGDNLIAWVWCRSNGGCDLYVTTAERTDHSLWDEMLDRAETVATARRRAGDPIEELYMWFVSEVPVVTPLLIARGFTRDELDGGHLLIHEQLSDVPVPALPDGYAFGWVDDSSIEERVELHRAAFTPSELTVGAYQRVRETWPYEPQLDRVVRGLSGQIVAGCTAWLDTENRAGLLEPVGTHPDHQSRGFGRAVVADALQSLSAFGALSAQIGTSGPAAHAAYVAAGFRSWKQEQTFRKRLIS